MLKARIASEKALAVRLKKAGNIPWYVCALEVTTLRARGLQVRTLWALLLSTSFN